MAEGQPLGRRPALAQEVLERRRQADLHSPGGKIFGWFTATESACIAVLYASVLSLLVYREMDLRGLRNADFDCLIGLSGGVDSSYLVYIAKEKFGLRPLL